MGNPIEPMLSVKCLPVTLGTSSQARYPREDSPNSNTVDIRLYHHSLGVATLETQLNPNRNCQATVQKEDASHVSMSGDL